MLGGCARTSLFRSDRLRCRSSHRSCRRRRCRCDLRVASGGGRGARGPLLRRRRPLIGVTSSRPRREDCWSWIMVVRRTGWTPCRRCICNVYHFHFEDGGDGGGSEIRTQTHAHLRGSCSRGRDDRCGVGSERAKNSEHSRLILCLLIIKAPALWRNKVNSALRCPRPCSLPSPSQSFGVLVHSPYPIQETAGFVL